MKIVKSILVATQLIEPHLRMIIKDCYPQEVVQEQIQPNYSTMKNLGNLVASSYPFLVVVPS